MSTPASPSVLPFLARATAIAVSGDSEAPPPGAWFDAHTHIGQNDPDGQTATPDEILAGLDAAGQQRALTFAMHEPDGYRGANDAVLAACEVSDGRLLPLARIAPRSPDAIAEAERCLDAGARGFKLHPRSDAFVLTEPNVERVVALAAERRMPVLFHAGRGIPELGFAAVELAERYPDARLILAHAAVSDLGLIAEPAARLPNLFFDTAWWHPGDLLQLFATVPSARILYASDMPYGPGLFSAFAALRCAAAVGMSRPAIELMIGGQLDRIIRGEDPLDGDPAPAKDALGPRFLPGERVASYVSNAVQLAIAGDGGNGGSNLREALELARSACQTVGDSPEDAVLAQAAAVLEIALEQARSVTEPTVELLTDAVIAALAAGYLATTPSAGVLPDPDGLLVAAA
ncbi:MAG: amidohydrolase family protein [Patulibacter sp.]|nr:amidohydrolase family protein [Patulibacter sp.]